MERIQFKLPIHVTKAPIIPYYIICKYSNINKYLELQKCLNDYKEYKYSKFEQTHDWYKAEGVKDTYPQGSVEQKNMLGMDIKGIKYANIVFGILPGGNDFHVELGAAICLDKFIVLLSDEMPEVLCENTAMYNYTNVLIVPTILTDVSIKNIISKYEDFYRDYLQKCRIKYFQ